MMRLIGTACLSICLIALVSYFSTSAPQVELVSAYSRAIRMIAEGHLLAKQGRYSDAAASFLKAKDLWKSSGKPGWQSAESLADAAVDRNPAALKDGMWMVKALTRSRRGQGRGSEDLTQKRPLPLDTPRPVKTHPPQVSSLASQSPPIVKEPTLLLPKLPPLGQGLKEGSSNRPSEEDMPTFDIKTSEPTDNSDWTLKWNRKSNPVEAGEMDDKRWGVVEHLWPKGNPQKEVFPEVPYYERQQTQARHSLPDSSQAHVSPARQGSAHVSPAPHAQAPAPSAAPLQPSSVTQSTPLQSAPTSTQVGTLACASRENISLLLARQYPTGSAALAPGAPQASGSQTTAPQGRIRSARCAALVLLASTPSKPAGQTQTLSARPAPPVGKELTCLRHATASKIRVVPTARLLLVPRASSKCKNVLLCQTKCADRAACVGAHSTRSLPARALRIRSVANARNCLARTDTTGAQGWAGKCEGPLPHWSPVLATPPPPPPPIHAPGPIEMRVPKLPPVLPRLPGLKVSERSNLSLLTCWFLQLIFPDNADWNTKGTYEEYVLPAPPVKWTGYQPGQVRARVVGGEKKGWETREGRGEWGG
eukprot:327772-Hanusia_phi.AAC.7